MDRREIDRLARAVVATVRNGSLGPVAHEIPDIAWRNPARRELATTPTAGNAATTPNEVASPIGIAALIDHTLLRAEATAADHERLCEEARRFGFAAVCVNGSWVGFCAGRLRGTGVRVAMVAGFPLGAVATRVKVREVEIAVEDGADEIDAVAPVGRMVDGDWDYVEDELRAVVRAAGSCVIKIILETSVLDPLRAVQAAALARAAGAHFVKTSTGMHPSGGATTEAVRLLRAAVGDEIGVKAAGGIRDCCTALDFVAAGATRIGTSSAVRIAECLQADTQSLAALAAAPDRHAPHCRTGRPDAGA